MSRGDLGSPRLVLVVLVQPCLSAGRPDSPARGRRQRVDLETRFGKRRPDDAAAQKPGRNVPLGNMHWGSMTKIARTPTYSREATRETSLHGLTPPHFSGAFELFGHAHSTMV